MRIKEDSCCQATRENFEMLELLGLQSSIDKGRIFNDIDYSKTDLFLTFNDGMKFKWIAGTNTSKYSKIDFDLIKKYLSSIELEFNFNDIVEYDGDIKETLILI